MATARGNRKRVPPSRKRYEESHPVVSVRLPSDLRNELNLLKIESGMSTADVIRIGLEKFKPDIKAAYERGVEDSYETAREMYEVTYWCSRCGERHLSITTEEAREAAAQYMYEHGWHDPKCR